MKKYIKYLYISVGLTVATALHSCSSDYLDTVPTQNVSTATALSTTENAAAVINGIAAVMTSQQYAFSQGYAGENRIKMIYGEYPGADFRYNALATGWYPIMNQLYYTETNTAYTQYPWYYYYTIIVNSNAIIDNIDAAAGTDEDKAFIKAQALTFRAYGYTQLLQLYSVRWQDSGNGDSLGVVLRLDESTTAMPRATMKECYAQIYTDLDNAVALYTSSGKDRASGSVWLPNINVAYATYARAALNRKDYSTALANAKLARSGYNLMSNNDYLAGFAKPTSEWIFGSYGDATENQWYWSFGTQFAANGYYANNTSYGAGAIASELIDSIPNDDVRKSLFISKEKFPAFDFTSATYVNQTSAILRGALADSALAYANKMTPSGLEAPYQSGVIFNGSHLKFWVFDTPGVSYLCHIRSSEMVLIEAEANYFLGNTTAAQASLVELNATSGRNADYTCNLTGDALWKEIKRYRGLELFGEGFSWFDYKRWGEDITRVSIANGGNSHAVTAITITATGSTWTWSIPLLETLYNNLIVQ